eukprot:CFRG5984T1
MGQKHSTVSEVKYSRSNKGNMWQPAGKRLENHTVEVVGQAITCIPNKLFCEDGPNVHLINFACNRIVKAPMFENPHVTGVLLWGNRLAHFEFSQHILRQLRVLDLGHNDITVVPSLESVPELIDLNLSYNNIEFIDANAFSVTQNLETLHLEYNLLAALPDSLFELPSLTKLHAQCNRICRLPQPQPQLRKMKELILRENEISHIDDTFFAELESLTLLDLTYNQLDTTAKSMWALPSVQHLLLAHNLICGDTLYGNGTTGLIGCAHLCTLDLSYNPLKCIPEGFLGRLVKIYTLRMRSCDLSSLPADIGQIRNVTMMDLADNSLRDLPTSVQSLGNLREVDLGRNLFGLSNGTGLRALWHCFSIQLLDLSSNGLSVVAKEINRLPFLCHLSLADNLLSDGIDLRCIALASESRFNVFRRRLIDLSYNRLTCFPRALCELRGVEHVFLHGNPFTSLPPSSYAKRFPRLETLTMTMLSDEKDKQSPCESLPYQHGDNNIGKDLQLPCVPEFKRSISMRRLYVYGCGRPKLHERMQDHLKDESKGVGVGGIDRGLCTSLFKETAWDDIYLRMEDYLDVTISGLGFSQLTGTSDIHGLEDRCCAYRVSVDPPLQKRVTLQISSSEDDSISPTSPSEYVDTTHSKHQQSHKHDYDDTALPLRYGDSFQAKLGFSSSGIGTDGVVYGVFDGHSGPYAAAYARRMFPHKMSSIRLQQSSQSTLDAIVAAMQSVFRSINLSLMESIRYDPDGNIDDGESSAQGKSPHGISGSTGLVVVVSEDHIVSGNIGDSRAILVCATDSDIQRVSTGIEERHRHRRQQGKYIQSARPFSPSTMDSFVTSLSMDHRPGWRMERERIKKTGGYVLERARQVLPGSGGSEMCRLTIPNNRGSRPLGDYGDCEESPEHKSISPTMNVSCKGFHSLGVSRGFGDFHCHPAVDGTPYINHVKRDRKQRFLCLASDGLWDYMSNHEVADMILNVC